MKKLCLKTKEGIECMIIPFLILKDLFFESKEDKEFKKWKIKDDEVRKMFEELHSKCISLPATEILDTLILIHSFHQLPRYGQWWSEGIEKSLVPYQVFSELSRKQNFTHTDAARLVGMLSWKEIKEPGYNCAWYPIIEVARKFPIESNIEKILCFGKYLKSILEININSGYDQIIRQHIKYTEEFSLQKG